MSACSSWAERYPSSIACSRTSRYASTRASRLRGKLEVTRSSHGIRPARCAFTNVGPDVAGHLNLRPPVRASAVVHLTPGHRDPRAGQVVRQQPGDRPGVPHRGVLGCVLDPGGGAAVLQLPRRPSQVRVRQLHRAQRRRRGSGPEPGSLELVVEELGVEARIVARPGCGQPAPGSPWGRPRRTQGHQARHER